MIYLVDDLTYYSNSREQLHKEGASVKSGRITP